MELDRHSQRLGHWPAGLERLPAGRPGVCGDALLFLFAPFVGREKALAIQLGMCTDDLAGRLMHPNRALARPMEVQGDVNNGAQGSGSREFPQVPEGSRGFPAFSSRSLFLVCCSEVFHSVFSYLQK